MTIKAYFTVLVTHLLLAIISAQYRSSDVTFFLYKNATDTIEQFTKNDVNIIAASLPIKFLVHGWSEDKTTRYYHKIAKAYHTKGAYNIIFVDWSPLAKLNYFQAVVAVRFAGSQIGETIISICQGLNIPFDSVHVIGHSMGAHVTGHAGKWVHQHAKMRIGRIFALDAAGPFFDGALPRNRLAVTDAEQVAALHTDAGLFGITQQVGTVDIYVNGGSGIQPGCPNVAETGISTIMNLLLDNENWTKSIFCSHHRSTYLFIEAILNDQKFIAVECNNELFFNLNMCINNNYFAYGEDIPRNISGTYYMTTPAISHV